MAQARLPTGGSQADAAPSRRGLILGVGALAATFAGRARAQGVLRTWPLGVQLFTVNAALKADLSGALRGLKAAGYQTVEAAGLQGLSAQAYRTRIEDAGLVCRGAHVAMGDLVADLDTHIADTLALGADWLVCASPMPPGPLPGRDWVAGMMAAMTPDAWKANAAHLAAIAPKVKQAGLKLSYHNHPMEFKDWGGFNGFDLLLAAVPPDQLQTEMDLGWVAASGHDPVAMMKRYAGRVALLHVKDMVQDPAVPIGYRSVSVGRGLIDWPAVFATAHAIGVQGFYVEQEPPFRQPVMEGLRASQAYLAKL